MSKIYTIGVKISDTSYYARQINVYEPALFENFLIEEKHSTIEYAEALIQGTESSNLWCYHEESPETLELSPLSLLDIKDIEDNTTCLWVSGEWFMSCTEYDKFYPLLNTVSEAINNKLGKDAEAKKHHLIAVEKAINII